jgi:hypothetical protein
MNTQTWEETAARIGDRYARHRMHNLDARIDELDARYDRHAREALQEIGALDRIRVRELPRLLGRDPSPFWTVLVGTIALVLWDRARRLGGSPELQVGSRPRSDTAFPSAAAALLFLEMDRSEIGRGETVHVAAEDLREHLLERARGRRAVYDRETGDLVRGWVEYVPTKASRVSTGRARHSERVELGVDVERVFRIAVPDALDRYMVRLALVGRWERVAKRQRLGSREGSAGQSALVRRAWGDRIEHGTRLQGIGSILRELGHDDLEVMRGRLKRARRAFEDELARRGLAPAALPPRRRRRPEPPAPLQSFGPMPLPEVA